MKRQMRSQNHGAISFPVSIKELQDINDFFNCATLTGDMEVILDTIRLEEDEDKAKLIEILGLDPETTVIPDTGYLVFYN